MKDYYGLTGVQLCCELVGWRWNLIAVEIGELETRVSDEQGRQISLDYAKNIWEKI